MRHWILGTLVVLAAAGAAWWWLLSGRKANPTAVSVTVPADAGTAVRPVEAADAAAAAAASGERKIKQVSPEQRRDLAARITAAQAARRARAATANPGGAAAEAPAVGDPGAMRTPDEVLQQLLAVLPELQEQVARCQVEHAPQVTRFKAKLALTGDADIGTVIDASELESVEGDPPLPAAFDDCVRDRMQTLELPPVATDAHFSTSLVFDLSGDAEDE